MKQNKLEKEIDLLAKEAGYPHIKLDHQTYMRILKTAHDNVFGEKSTPSTEERTDSGEGWSIVANGSGKRITDINGKNICSMYSESMELAPLIASVPILKTENEHYREQNRIDRKSLDKLISENESLKAANKELKKAIEYYQKGVGHFFKCINFGSSFLDAEAIQFMNEHELKFKKALNNNQIK